MSTQHENQQPEAAKPASKRRRALLSAALKSTPYALTLASGSALANASAFQCIDNTRKEAGTLSNKQAVLVQDLDRHIRVQVPEYTLKAVAERQLVERKTDGSVDPDGNGDPVPILDSDGNTQVEITREETYTIYIPGGDISNQSAWYVHTGETTNMLEPVELLQPESGETIRLEGPSSTGGFVYVLRFFKPINGDTGLDASCRQYPGTDVGDVGVGLDGITPLNGSCTLSVDPGKVVCP